MFWAEKKKLPYTMEHLLQIVSLLILPYHCQARPVYPVTLPGGAWPWGSVEEEQPKPTESEDFVTIFPPVSAVSASAQIIEPTSLPPEPVTLEDGRWVWGEVVDHV